MRQPGDVAVPEGGRSTAASAQLGVLSPTQLAALDASEPSARSRRAFVGISFAAGVVCLMPQQWVSGAICLVVSLGAYLWHRRQLARELTEARPGASAVAAPGAAASDASSSER